MSEEVIAQIQADERIRDLGLPRDKLENLAKLTEQLHRDCPLFRRLPLGELAYIAHAGEIETHERGDVLIKEGATDRVMYVVLKGQLRVWHRNPEGKTQLLGFHYPGDISGELIMTTGAPRTATIDVVEESEVVAFGEEGWKRITAHPSLENRIRREGAERFRENNYPFKGKHLDEVLVLRARKSWVVLLRRILAPILFSFVVLAIVSVLSGYEQLEFNIAVSVGLAVVVAVLLWVLWMWQDWRNDDYIVTSKRIIHVERILIPPFPVERQEVAIQMIQDIRTISQGIWTLIFGVKSIVVRTMGTGTVFFPDLHNADEVREKIIQTQQRVTARTSIPNQQLIYQRLAEELGQHVNNVVIKLDSDPQEEVKKAIHRGDGLLDYLVPYTRIEEPGMITWRQHWLVMLRKVLLPMFCGFLALVLIILTLVYGESWGIQSGIWAIPGGVLLLVSAVWYLWRYEEWRNHVYQVTDSRIIDIEGTPFHLWKESRTEGLFNVIQNVTYDSPNLLFRALSIGFVQIDTAAEQGAYTFDWVSHPDEVQQEIFRRWAAYREREKEATIRRNQQDFLDWIVQYDRLVHRKE